MREVRFTVDLSASISPDEGTLIPEGFYSNYIEQVQKDMNSSYRHALKLCVAVILQKSEEIFHLGILPVTAQFNWADRCIGSLYIVLECLA